MTELAHQQAQHRPSGLESTMLEQCRSGECRSQHTQYNPLQGSARHTELSLKDNSGLCYREKMVSKLHNDRLLWSGSSVGNSTLFFMPETLTLPCVWSKGLLCEGALIKSTAIIVLGAKHLKLVTANNSGGFLTTFLIIFPCFPDKGTKKYGTYFSGFEATLQCSL